LQISDAQENMATFTGAYAHPAVAVRADKLVSTHGKYLQALFRFNFSENARRSVSVLATKSGLFFRLVFLIAEMLLKTQGCIHNE